MNNAKWILGVIGFVSLQVSAAPTALTKLQNEINAKLQQKHILGKVHVLDGTDPQPPTPIRVATGRVRIMKTQMTKNSQGGYDVTESEVCSGQGPMNVYDVRTSGNFSLDESKDIILSCPSTINGSPATVKLVGVLVLLKDNMFGAVADYKIALPILIYGSSSPGGPSTGTFVSALAGSFDIAAKSILTVAEPAQVYTCSTSGTTTSCDPDINESFSAFLDAQD